MLCESMSVLVCLCIYVCECASACVSVCEVCVYQLAYPLGTPVAQAILTFAHALSTIVHSFHLWVPSH